MAKRNTGIRNKVYREMEGDELLWWRKVMSAPCSGNIDEEPRGEDGVPLKDEVSWNGDTWD